MNITNTLTNDGTSELSAFMEYTSYGALIPNIVPRSVKDLQEAKYSDVIGAKRHEYCHEERCNHRNGYCQSTYDPDG